jgi:Holliday junction DNA helicase RuvA
MFYRIKGILTVKRPFFCAIDTGGVEYAITVPLKVIENLPQEGNEVSLYIYPVVSEDKFELFGFLSEREKNLFEKLISISGIGPRVALQILSRYSADEFFELIKRKDERAISKIKGVGRKRAGQILLEFKDYVTEEHVEGIDIEEVISALVRLGLKRSEARNMVMSKLREKRYENIQDLITEILAGKS